MIKKYLFVLLVGIILDVSCFSQVELGGTCGFGITNNYLTIDAAPEVSYRFIEHLRVGFSPFILYNSDLSSSYWTRMYGTRVFGEYHFDFNVFVHAEYEIANISDSEGYSANMDAFPIGIGGTTALTEHSEAYLLILYDVLYDESWAIRTNPMFRAGVRYRF